MSRATSDLDVLDGRHSMTWQADRLPACYTAGLRLGAAPSARVVIHAYRLDD